MRAQALVLCAALLAAPTGVFAQASAPPAQAGSGVVTATDTSKPAPKLMDAARRHYDDAIQFFKEGRYDAARIEFEASYALSKEPDLLYNLSTTAEKQGQLADAIRFAERYLEAKPNAEDAETVRKRIASLRTQQTHGSPGPAAPVSPSSAPQPDLSIAKQDQPPPTIPSPPKAALALLGWGGVWLLSGIGTGIAAIVTDKQVSGMESIYFSDLQALNQRGDRLNTATGVLLVAGGITAVAGASWLIAWKVKSRQKQP